MSINPKPGGKWYFSFSLTPKPANVVVLRFPAHLWAKKLSCLYVTPFDIFLWFVSQNTVNTVAPHSSLSLGPGDRERWGSALFTGWIESTNSKIKSYAFSSDPFWTECWCVFFNYNSLLVTAEDIVSRLKVSSSCSTIIACVAGAGFFRAKEEISGTREGKNGEGPLPFVRVTLARPVKKTWPATLF